MLPLGLLMGGEEGEVMEIRGGEHNETCCSCSGKSDRRGQVCRMEDMGIRIGKSVQMLTNGGHGPLLVKVDESRIAIGRGMAMKVMVRRKG
jgi:ferrous iron transport protein A